MKNVSIQIQSVIYKNQKDALFKAIEGINTSVGVCEKKGIGVDAVLCYGDASPDAVLEKEVFEYFEKEFSNFSFGYDIFGFNSGTARGHNRLGAECNTDYMMIMNPDVILENSCLWELLRLFKDDCVGMAEARQTPLELAKIYDTDTLETEWVSTACTVFRTKIFHKLNGFDYETFFMYCDDLDFSWRLRLEGYKILYNPNAVIYHAKVLGNSGEWKPTSAEIYYSAEAAILMAYKYSNPDRVEKLLNQFESVGGTDEKKAAAEFRKRREEGRLPAPIDPEHKVAKFIGDNYSLMRFSYNK